MAWKLPLAGVLIGIVLDFVLPFWGIPLVAASAAWWGVARSLSGAPRREAEDEPWGLAGFAVLVFIFGIHYALITRGTGHPLGPELLGAAFDSLASNLLRGSAQVAPEAIRWEGMAVEGRTYMYFGPWPALLRIPLDWIAPGQVGQWSKLSCFLASVLAVTAFGCVAGNRIVRNSALAAADGGFFLAVSLLGFGLATPLVYLMHTGTIYHESIAWGLCGSLWGIHFLFRLLDSAGEAADPDFGALLGLATVAGLTLLARVTFGAPLFVVLAVVCGFSLQRAWREGEGGAGRWIGRAAPALIPAVLCLLFQLWYNLDRFGSPFTFVDYRYVAYVVDDSQSWQVMQRTGPFDLGRLWNGFANYFGLRAAYFWGQFPWVRVVPPSYPDADLYARIFRSYLVSLSVVSAWIVAGAALGAAYCFRRPTPWQARLCGAAFLIQLVVVMSFFIMEQRYSLDFFPFLVFAYAFFLTGAAARRPLRGRPKDLATALLFLVALSTVTSLSSALSAIPTSGPGLPQEYKVRWVERFRSVDALLGRRVAQSPSSPSAPEAQAP